MTNDDAFEYVWKLISKSEEDEGEKWSKKYEAAHSEGDQETMDRMNADNEADERQLNPADPDQRLINEGVADSGPIEYEDPCPHCGAGGPPPSDAFEAEHTLIDYGLDGDYYQTYQCFNCSGQWENRWSFSEVVLR